MSIINPPLNTASPLRSMKANHVAVRVPDLAQAIQWYADKLDFRFVHEWVFGDLKLAYLAAPNDDSFWLELIGGGAPDKKAAYADLGESLQPAGYHHLCFAVDSVDETLVELKQRNVRIVSEAFTLPSISRRLAFFADPWSNLIELAQVIED